MEKDKAAYTIDQLYHLKEIYRCQGENVCWLTKDLLVAIKQSVKDDERLMEKVKKVEDAILLFEG
jgi:multimeric flavodoxin WrbA